MSIFSFKKEITPDTILQRKPDLLFNNIDGEVVMLSIENSEYYFMDKVGSRIWELLEQPLTFGKLVYKLRNEYIVSEQQCINDTLEFLYNIYNKRLLLND